MFRKSSDATPRRLAFLHFRRTSNVPKPVKPYIQIPVGANAPKIINAVIEIPKGSKNKYEYAAEYDCFKLDRVLHSPMHYPTAYGFVPSTLFTDGDPLDIMILIDEPTFTGCLVEVKPIGLLRMVDAGQVDDKVIAVAIGDQRYAHYESLEQVKPHMLVEIEYFYSIYKDLEGKQTQVQGWVNIDDAHVAISESIDRYNAQTA